MKHLEAHGLHSVPPAGVVGASEQEHGGGADHSRQFPGDGPEGTKHTCLCEHAVTFVRIVKGIEAGAQTLLISDGQTSLVVSLLEKVSACWVVPCHFLALAIKTVLTLLTSTVIVHILEAWVLLDMGEDFTLLVGDVLDENFSN